MSCEIRNKTTGELKPFYEVNGVMYNTYREALNNVEEGGNIEVNFINSENTHQAKTEEEFYNVDYDFVTYKGEIKVKDSAKVTVGSIPVTFNTSTQDGIVNTLIKDGLANEVVQKADGNIILSPNGSTQTVAGINAEDILIEVQANSESHGYIRKGNTYIITPTFGKVKVGDNHYTEQEIQEMVDNEDFSFTEIPELFMYRQERIKGLEKTYKKGNKVKKETTDTDESLRTQIMSFLNSMGISLESIEGYKKKYNVKNGVDPDAKALLDIANQVIAFKDGEITIEELTEEAAHLIIEGWNQSEIAELLNEVEGTQEWAEHSEAYRELYNAIYPEAQVEEAVRREILGKFLANQLKNPTNRSETETNIFAKIIQKLSEFFSAVTARTNKETNKKLIDFSNRVKVLLENRELDSQVSKETIKGSSMTTMYSISESSPYYQVYNKAAALLETLERELNTLQSLSNSPSTLKLAVERQKSLLKDVKERGDLSEVQLSVMGLFGIFDTKVRELQTILDSTKDGEMIGVNERQVYEILNTQLLPLVQAVGSAYKKRVGGKTSLLIDDTLTRFSDLSGDMNNRVLYNSDKALEETIRRRAGNEAAERVKELMKQEHKDVSWFFKMFGQIILSKVPQHGQLGKLIHDIVVFTNANFVRESAPFMERLSKVSKRLPELIKGEYILSHRDRDAIQEKRNEARAQALKSVLNLKEPVSELKKTEWTPSEVEKFIIAKDDTLPVMELVDKWRFESDYLTLKAEVKKSSKQEDNRLAQMELYRELNISPETYKIIQSHKKDSGRIYQKMGANPDPNDPTNRSLERELNGVKISRNNYASPFLPHSGNKEGLTLLPLSEYEIGNPDQVKIKGGQVIEIDRSVATKEALIAFELNKLSRYSAERKEIAEQMLASNPNADTSSTGWTKDSAGKWKDSKSFFDSGDSSRLKPELKKIWEREYQEGIDKGLSPENAKKIANKRSYKWMQRMASISFSQEYWESMVFNNTIEETYNNNKHIMPNSGAIVAKLSFISRNKAIIASILKKYQEAYDYKEISVQDMSLADREAILRLEELNRFELRTILERFEHFGVEVNFEKFEGSEKQPNNSFYDIYKESNLGKEYEDSTPQEKIGFLKTQIAPDQLDPYGKFERAVNNQVTGTKRIPEKFEEIIKELGFTEITDQNKYDILETYLKRRLPVYYQRFAPDGYAELLQYLEDNMHEAVQDGHTIIDRLLNGEVDNFEMSMSQLTQQERGIVYEQSVEEYKKKYDEAQQIKDRGERLLKTYESFLHINGEDDASFSETTIDRTFLQKFGMRVKPDGTLTAPTKDLELFEGMLDVLRVRAMSLEKFNEILKVSVFQYARMPRTKTERLIIDPAKGLKYYRDDILKYREDEEEASFLRSESRRIPKLGFAKMPIEDMSTDLYRIAFLDLKNAEGYKQKSENLGRALAIMESLARVKVKGKATRESDIYQMGQNTIDEAFFGRHTTWQSSYEVFGQRIDVSKVLKVLRNFVQTHSLGFSLPVAGTSLATATTNKFIQRFVNFHLYDKASNRAWGEFLKLSPGSMSDMGGIYSDAKLDKIMQNFGNFDVTERLANASFGFGTRNLTNINKMAFAIHNMANFPVIPRVVLSKMMEYRIIDGKFTSWSNYLTQQKTIDPNVKVGELREKFDKEADKSFYDYVEFSDNSVFDYKKLVSSKVLKNPNGVPLTEEEIKKEMDEVFADVSSDISYNISQYDGLIHESQRIEAQRHPIFSFLTMFRGWLSIASSRNFNSEFYNHQTGNIEEGIITTLGKSINSIVKGKLKGNENPMDVGRIVFSEMTPSQKANLKTLGFTIGALGALVLLVGTMIGYTDDGDDEDYVMKLASYVALRTLNETFSASVGIGSEYYSFLENPVSATTTIKAAFSILNVADAGRTITKGQYEGWNAYTANLYKMTFFKNFYLLSDVSHIEAARSGYSYFNRKGALYSPIVLSQLLAEEVEDSN